MKRIRPDYYDKFACIADQCSITCCQEWKIGVDADTNRKWKKIFPPKDVSPQKKNLSAYTTKKDGGRVIELTEEHKCPFLNENKLCKLVTAYGDNVLSETCAVFPREVHRFKTHEEETLMPCCPAVIDLLREEEPQRIYAREIEQKSEQTENPFLREHARFYIREKLTELFLDEDYRVEESLLCGFYIIRELFDKCEQDEKLSELAEDYFSEENQLQLRRAIAEKERDSFATIEERNELLQDLAVNYRKEGLYRNYLNPVIEKAEELSGLFENIGNPADAAGQSADLETEMADRMHAFESEFQAYNPLMRKFLINEFNADLLMPDGDLESLLVQYQWIAMEYGVIRHSIFLRWLLDGQKEIAYETVRDYIVIICRMTGYDEEDIYEYLENSFEELIWDWGYLALVVG